MTDKKVDENWKKRAAEEKNGLVDEPSAGDALPQAEFTSFLSGLASQVLVGLGEATNPVTGNVEKNLAQAKYTIDLLQVLKDKTEGNLTDSEDRFLNGMLYELRMRYVEVSD